MSEPDDSDAKEPAPSPAEDSEAAPASRPARVRKEPVTLWQRATYRWTAITAVMATLLVVYTQHPYYLGNQFAPFRAVYAPAFVLWLVLGLFYCKATLEKFKGMRFTMRDGGLHLLLLAKAFQEKRFWKMAVKPRLRTTLLGIVVKAFYMPLMVGFFSGHANGIAEAWLRHKNLAGLRFVLVKGYPWDQAKSWFVQLSARLPDFVPSGADFAGLFTASSWTRDNIGWGLGVAYDITFFIDCGWALMGYGLESRWLGNKTRSVEPTALGWAAALSCYPPYNNVLGTYLPLDNGPSRNVRADTLFAMGTIGIVAIALYLCAAIALDADRRVPWLAGMREWWLARRRTSTIATVIIVGVAGGLYVLVKGFTNEDTLLFVRGVIVVLFFIYASATVAFGFKFSNLTNRGTISRGPYAVIRHPAYVCKCAAWWLEHLPTMTLTKGFFLSLLCGVYALRAWTEERHLSMDPDYREYKKKVPWRIIPGVF